MTTFSYNELITIIQILIVFVCVCVIYIINIRTRYVYIRIDNKTTQRYTRLYTTYDDSLYHLIKANTLMTLIEREDVYLRLENKKDELIKRRQYCLNKEDENKEDENKEDENKEDADI